MSKKQHMDLSFLKNVLLKNVDHHLSLQQLLICWWKVWP